MARTKATLVKDILGDNYGAKEDGTLPDLNQFIAGANLIVTRVNACAADKGITLSASELEEIERWLSAHFYTRSDLTAASKSTEGASASFHGQTAMDLDASFYGQTAKMLDYSGCLNAISKRQFAGGFWAGRPPSEQTAYEDRD